MIARLLLPSLIFALALAGCEPNRFNCVDGSGTRTTKERELATFTAIAVQGSIDVVLEHGPNHQATVVCEGNLHRLLQTKVDRNTLQIQWDGSTCVRPNEPVTVTITAPEIRGLQLSGSGLVTADSLHGEVVNINNTGSGAIDVRNVNATELRIDVAGSGDVDADGTATTLDYTASGSGEISALGLVGRDASARISGSGDIRLHADSTLNATITGSGDILYTGTPTVTSSISGSGTVKKL